MWDIYLRYNWKNAPSKRMAISVEKITHPFSASSSSSEATLLHSVTPPLRTKGPKFRIIWENVPNNAPPTAFGCIIENINNYTKNEFRQKIVQRPKLNAYGAMIIEVNYHEELSFQTAVKNAVTYNERKNVSIYTSNSSETNSPRAWNIGLQLEFEMRMNYCDDTKWPKDLFTARSAPPLYVWDSPLHYIENAWWALEKKKKNTRRERWAAHPGFCRNL